MEFIDSPLISIITPSFNRSWSIEACIKSLQMQSFNNYEHLIIDGGSTDGTLEILKKLSSLDKRIRFISEPDSGMYDAINKGMCLARGSIISYLNTDDFYLPETLKIVVQCFTEKKSISIVYGQWMSWHLESGFLEILPVLKYTKEDIATFAVLPQPSVFFLRSVIEAISCFDLEYSLLADNDFFSKAVIAGFKLHRINEYLSIQLIHSENLLAGNVSASNISVKEGVKYREARLKELLGIHKGSRGIKYRLILSKLKCKFLPILWRVVLIKMIFATDFPGTTKRFSSIILEYGGVSAGSIFGRYLFTKADRSNCVYLKVTIEDISLILGFQPYFNLSVHAEHKDEK